MNRLVFLLALFCCSSLFSLWSGNPLLPKIPEEGPMTSRESWMTVKIGYLGWDTFERKIDGLKKAHLWSNGAILSCDLFEKVSLYGYAGAARINAKRGSCTYRSKTALGGLVGASGLLYEHGGFSLGVDAKYYQAGAPLSSSLGGSFLYREWQASCAAAYDYAPIYPYLGARYAHALLRLSKPHCATYSSDIPVGLYLGASYAPATTFALSLEAGLINEYSLSLMLTARL